MKMKTQSKGKRLEYMVRDKLIESGLDKYARRSIMSGATWMHKGDIVTSLNLHIECKNQERGNLWEAYNQALRDRPTARLTPVVVAKRNQTQPFCFLSLDDFINILSFAVKAGWK